MTDSNYVIGIDFGTDSVRSILVQASDGVEVATSVFYYPRWKKGLFCDPTKQQFRQHPLDYIEGLELTIKDIVSKAGKEIADKIRAISVDTTGSTPVAVDATGVPLAMLNGFKNNPNAMFVLWKDHTSIQEAADINAAAAKSETNYLQFVGGIYSSEWFWAKLLHILRKDVLVREAIHSFVEHCDWVPYMLCGGNDIKKLKRGVCSAGHKCLWAEEFGGLPPNDFFVSVDPLLADFTEKLFTETYCADEAVGNLSAEWAEKLGLNESVLIGIGGFDCHFGAVGGQIEPYYLSKVMGTSTCDMLVAPIEDVKGKLVRGICGQVNGSIIPGMLGMEAGQSAFGDAYAWFKNILSWPLENLLANIHALSDQQIAIIKESIEKDILVELGNQAALLPFEEESELASDWLNGRRTPDANQSLKAAFAGLNLGTDAPRMYRALVEATCFGAKRIVDRFVEQGIPVKGLIGLGGVAKKSHFIMQMMADVMDMPIKINNSEQTCALGGAMFAATVAGIYPKIEDAMVAMGQGFDQVYYPDATKVAVYARRYMAYKTLGSFIENNMIVNH